MRPMDSRDVDEAVAEMVRVLAPHESADWRRPAGPLAWSCWETAAHVAHDLLAYAGQLAALPDAAYLPFDLVVSDDASPRDLLRTVTAAGRLLSTVLAASDPSVRAWRWGPTDRSGFAALGVNETLVHTHDITAGLGIAWQPPASLCRAVLARLFPDAPVGEPVQALLWSTGRTDLPGRPRPTSWVLRAAVGQVAEPVGDGRVDP
nr:maleylpyruvate isomerase N-terminal domain-containing protein [Micromonospora siamensis]